MPDYIRNVHELDRALYIYASAVAHLVTQYVHHFRVVAYCCFYHTLPLAESKSNKRRALLAMVVEDRVRDGDDPATFRQGAAEGEAVALTQRPDVGGDEVGARRAEDREARLLQARPEQIAFGDGAVGLSGGLGGSGWAVGAWEVLPEVDPASGGGRLWMLIENMPSASSARRHRIASAP
ncbi:hypothetical protein I3F60_20850 [Streptomyces sp. MUM 136J]|nr:hypothetical protein [Streptomyces sp. MUM 2J]MCH0571681.1 hypothetical protein [Streptomyces sp. MUM 136J]